MEIIETIGNYNSDNLIDVEIIATAVIGGGALLNGGKTVLDYCAM